MSGMRRNINDNTANNNRTTNNNINGHATIFLFRANTNRALPSSRALRCGSAGSAGCPAHAADDAALMCARRIARLRESAPGRQRGPLPWHQPHAAKVCCRADQCNTCREHTLGGFWGRAHNNTNAYSFRDLNRYETRA